MASTMIHITSQLADTTDANINAAVTAIRTGTSTLSTTAIDPLLAALKDQGRHNSVEYDILAGEWCDAAKREDEAEQQQRRWCIDIALSRILPAIAAGESTADSVELGELLTIMRVAGMTGTAEYHTIYREWLRRFPEEATCQLVAAWLERFEREEGGFTGFTSYDLVRLYGKEISLGVKQVEAELQRLAGVGRLVRGELTADCGMYAIAGWAASIGLDEEQRTVPLGGKLETS